MTPGVLFATLVPIGVLIVVALARLFNHAGRDANRLDNVEKDICEIKSDVKFLVRRLTGNPRSEDSENSGMGRQRP